MVNLVTEHVLDVHHWNDKLFSFRTTRDPGLRFDSGHFVMLGLHNGERPLMRATPSPARTTRSTWSSCR